MSFFIGLSRGPCADRPLLNRIGQGKSNDVRAPSRLEALLASVAAQRGADTRLRQFCRFYRSINWGRVFDKYRFLPPHKARLDHIDRPCRYG
jgi:hypothetical protein